MSDVQAVRVFDHTLRTLLCIMALVAAAGTTYVAVNRLPVAHATAACSGTTVNATDCTVTANSSLQFVPKTITVRQGVTVTWSNTAGFEHTSTSDPSTSDSWNLALPGGTSSSHRFVNVGTDGYYCQIHGSPGSGMFGTITVVGPSAARLIWFKAVRASGVTHFRWEITRHSDISAFNLRSRGRRLNRSIIAVRPNQSVYHFTRMGTVGRRVSLDMILNDGATLVNGPYRIR